MMKSVKIARLVVGVLISTLLLQVTVFGNDEEQENFIFFDGLTLSTDLDTASHIGA